MQFGQQQPTEIPSELRGKIDGIVNKDKIVLFMKGDRQMPQCGFSDTVVKVLNFYDVDYETYDVLMNPDLRSGLKVYSEWPTFPQLYVNGEFVGGCDIIMEMHQNQEIEAVLKK